MKQHNDVRVDVVADSLAWQIARRSQPDLKRMREYLPLGGRQFLFDKMESLLPHGGISSLNELFDADTQTINRWRNGAEPFPEHRLGSAITRMEAADVPETAVARATINAVLRAKIIAAYLREHLDEVLPHKHGRAKTKLLGWQFADRADKPSFRELIKAPDQQEQDVDASRLRGIRVPFPHQMQPIEGGPVWLPFRRRSILFGIWKHCVYGGRELPLVVALREFKPAPYLLGFEHGMRPITLEQIAGIHAKRGTTPALLPAYHRGQWSLVAKYMFVEPLDYVLADDVGDPKVFHAHRSAVAWYLKEIHRRGELLDGSSVKFGLLTKQILHFV